jgi:hypothetical protein
MLNKQTFRSLSTKELKQGYQSSNESSEEPVCKFGLNDVMFAERLPEQICYASICKHGCRWMLQTKNSSHDMCHRAGYNHSTATYRIKPQSIKCIQMFNIIRAQFILFVIFKKLSSIQLTRHLFAISTGYLNLQNFEGESLPMWTLVFYSFLKPWHDQY